MRLTFRREAAVLIGVLAVAFPYVHASPLPIHREDASESVSGAWSKHRVAHPSNVITSLTPLSPPSTPSLDMISHLPTLSVASYRISLPFTSSKILRIFSNWQNDELSPTTRDSALRLLAVGAMPRSKEWERNPRRGWAGDRRRRLETSRSREWEASQKLGWGASLENTVPHASVSASCGCYLAQTVSQHRFPAPQEIPDPGRVVERNIAALQEDVTEEEASRVMDGSGSSRSRRSPSDARDLTKKEADRVMADMGQTWGRSLDKEEVGLLMSDDGRTWSKRESWATEDSTSSTSEFVGSGVSFFLSFAHS